ncbi:MAG: hypothetical protein EZS28_017500 [Streblomastix strix]|uniref:Uncharacterized protein n=1 Tax=Streblomastix strix TaxID=222440 RepID=A0A5J4VXB2_9EUKA|nr:MAG: hypothetical protein EZS28_017500 [Streblomastix strix]
MNYESRLILKQQLIIFYYQVFNSDIASARANAADVILQSPVINLDTVAYCNLIDGSYGKKNIGTSSNGVARQKI